MPIEARSDAGAVFALLRQVGGEGGGGSLSLP